MGRGLSGERDASEEVVLQRPPLLRPLRRRRLRMPPIALELRLLLVEARVERGVHQGLGRAAQVGLEQPVEEVHEELLPMAWPSSVKLAAEKEARRQGWGEDEG